LIVTAVLSVEQTGDVKTITHFDEAQNKVFVERIQDTDWYIDRAKRMSEQWNSDDRKKHEMYYAGSIPSIVVEKFCNDNRITFREFMVNPEHVKRLLNDPDYSALRIWKGRV
jgi:hypothetical protein